VRDCECERGANDRNRFYDDGVMIYRLTSGLTIFDIIDGAKYLLIGSSDAS